MTQFLSTPSARRATPKYHEKQYNRSDFYPRPLRGGRPVNNGCSETPQQISIHALCEEGDKKLYGNDKKRYQFLSTPSARRATHTSETHTQR